MTQNQSSGSASTDGANEVGERKSPTHRILAGSRVGGAMQRFREAVVESRLSRLGVHLSQIVQASFLYRWLTAEPEPEVIVIDLRETYTVGPVIALFDRVLSALEPSWTESRLKRGVDALVALGERAAETRPGQLLMTLFEPPEPPKRTDADVTNKQDRDRDQSSRNG